MDLQLISYALLISGSLLIAKSFITLDIKNIVISYWGANPHYIKAITLQKYETGFGLCLFIIGSLIQIYIYNQNLQTIFINVIFISIIMIYVFIRLSYFFMKKEVFLKLKERIKDKSFKNWKHIIQHEGLAKRHLEPNIEPPTAEIKLKNLREARANLINWASVFDIKIKNNISNQELINVLEKYLYS